MTEIKKKITITGQIREDLDVELEIETVMHGSVFSFLPIACGNLCLEDHLDITKDLIYKTSIGYRLNKQHIIDFRSAS